uniref:Uncharacterized protein n=1 Tax=Astyanax mexicanus TaxID=7994 RepID=A0A8B9J8Y9_ASTMX
LRYYLCPISVILVSSGSRGNKLLFRYPFLRVSENIASSFLEVLNNSCCFSSRCVSQMLKKRMCSL